MGGCAGCRAPDPATVAGVHAHHTGIDKLDAVRHLFTIRPWLPPVTARLRARQDRLRLDSGSLVNTSNEAFPGYFRRCSALPRRCVETFCYAPRSVKGFTLCVDGQSATESDRSLLR